MTQETRQGSDLEERSDEVRRLLLAMGFHRVGFAKAAEVPGADRLRSWLARGFDGSMAWLARSLERRVDPREIVRGARSVIVVAVHYRPPSSAEGRSSERGRISCYAQGEDYHRVLGRRLRKACEVLHERHPATYRWYVDTGPVLERAWAQEAGLGWIGKNTCAIDPRSGSYFFLGVIIATLELLPDPAASDHCGTCRLCLDACPTDAFAAPWELDARRCISYLTIEHRGAYDSELEEGVGDLLFGCDICQEVCPFNRQPGADEASGDPELTPRPENLAPRLEELLELDEESFRRRFRHSPVRRARYAGLLRNTVVALGNSSFHGALELLDRIGESRVVRENQDLEEVWRRARERSARRREGR